MKKKLLYILTAVGCLITQSAMACSCARSTFEGAFQSARVVAAVTVISTNDNKTVQIQFDKVWKGKAPKTTSAKVVSGLSASCSPTAELSPPKGTRYLLFTGNITAEEALTIHLDTCGRSAEYSEREADITALGIYEQKLYPIQKRIESAPNDMKLLYEKAVFLNAYDDSINASEALRTVTQKAPENAEAWSLYADITFRDAELIRPYGEHAEQLRTKKDALYTDALAYAEKALALAPQDMQAKKIKANSLLKLGRNDEVSYDRVDFASARLENANFANKTLHNASFEKASLYGSEFVDSTLSNVNLSKANFQRARFTRTTLENVNFDEGQITEAGYNPRNPMPEFVNGGFRDSTIAGSSLKKTQFRAPLINTRIKDSDFTEASFYSGHNEFEQIIFSHVTAENAKFNKARITSNTFHLAEISESTFKNCDFSEARIGVRIIKSDFSTSKMEGVDLAGAMFDCETRWPEGFDPIAHGASPETPSCNGKKLAAPNFEGRVFNQFHSFGPVNLEGANFRNAVLNGARFYGANLKNADFTDAKIENADFRKANLQNAKLKNITLYGVNFDEANLKNTDFMGAYFSNARFGKTNLDEAKLTLAKIPAPAVDKISDEMTPEKHHFVYWANNHNGNDKDGRACLRLDVKPFNMADADLRGVNLSYACLEGMDFTNAKLDKASLYNADLTHAKLEGTSLVGAKYSCDTVMPSTYSLLLEKMIRIGYGGCSDITVRHPAPKLANADLSGMKLWQANLQNADLRGADLSNTWLVYADMTGADLTGANLKGAIYDQATKWPAGFDYTAAGAVRGENVGGNME